MYRRFSWGRFRSSRVLCVFLAVDLSWTLLDLAIHWEKAWKFTHMLCCFVTQTQRFWGNASCLGGCFALMIEWKLLKIMERLFGFSSTKLYRSKVCVLGRMFLMLFVKLGEFPKKSRWQVSRKIAGKFHWRPVLIETPVGQKLISGPNTQTSKRKTCQNREC